MRRLIIRPGAIGDFVVSLARARISSRRLPRGLDPPPHRPSRPLRRPRPPHRRHRARPHRNHARPPARARRLRRHRLLVRRQSPRIASRSETLAGPLLSRPAPGARQRTRHRFLPEPARPAARRDRAVRCHQTRENFAVIHPFSGSPRKNWPLAKFRAARRPPRTSHARPLVLRPDDPPLPGAVRIDDLWDLACWLARARIYIGNDSGVTHLAAAVGTPVLAIFGPTDPSVWAPRGRHVRVVTVKMET